MAEVQVEMLQAREAWLPQEQAQQQPPHEIIPDQLQEITLCLMQDRDQEHLLPTRCKIR